VNQTFQILKGKFDVSKPHFSIENFLKKAISDEFF